MRKNMLVKQYFVLFVTVVILMLPGCEGAAEREEMYLKKAQAFSDEGNYEKMNVELKNVLQINPKNIEARYLLALEAERKQDWRKMFNNLSLVVKENPGHIDAQIGLGKLYLLSDSVDKTKEIIALVSKKSPNNADIMALKAVLALKEGDKAGADLLLDEALAIEPGHYDASLLKVNILGAEKKLPEALVVVDAALKKNSKKLSLSLVKIKLLSALGRKQDVENLLIQLIPQNPKNQKFYYALAKIYLQDKKIDKTEGLLRELVMQLPDENQPKVVLYDFWLAHKDLQQAENEADKMILANPENFDFRFAKLILYKKLPERMEQELKQIVKDDLTGLSGIKARNALIKIFAAKGNRSQANDLINETLEIDPRNAEALLSRARFALLDEAYDAAIADARAVLRSEPSSEKALMIQANAEIKLKEIELAQATLERILEVNPKNLAATKDLIKVKISQKNVQGGIKLLEKARDTFKADKEIKLMLIDLYAQAKDWEKAEKIVENLQKIPGTEELSHFKLAQLYVGQKKFSQANIEFRRILETKPLALKALSGAVNSYLALEKNKEAEKLLDTTINNHKDNPVLLTMRANLYLSQKQLLKAEEMFLKVIALKPEVEVGYSNLASFYLQQRQLDKAIDSYQQGLEVLPENLKILMQLGVLNTIKGDVEHAVIAYEKILAIQPDNLLVINNLSAVLSDSSDPKHVEKSYTVAQPLKTSESPFFMDTYGWVLFQNGYVNEAAAILEMAVLKKADVAEMHYHLGMAYLALDKKTEALSELNKAVTDKARYKGLEKAKAALEKLNKL